MVLHGGRIENEDGPVTDGPLMVEGYGALPVATETFGPLEMYAVIPEAEKQYNGDRTQQVGHIDKPVGWTDGGLRLDPVPVAPQPAPYTVFRGDNDHLAKTPAQRQADSIRLLASAPGYVYLGSPYSKYEDHDEAARVVSAAAASLMRQGLRVYSPIAHGHAVAAHGLPLTWDFWKDQCQPMIDAASALIVLTMDGHSESVGLRYELDEFIRAAKPILYLSPADCGVEERVAMGRAA